MNFPGSFSKDSSIDKARPQLGQVSLFHQGVMRVKVLGDDEIQNGIPQKFETLIGAPALPKLGEIGPVEKGFNEEPPVAGNVAKSLLDPVKIELLLNRFRKVFFPCDATVLVGSPAAGEETENGFHNVVHQ